MSGRIYKRIENVENRTSQVEKELDELKNRRDKQCSTGQLDNVDNQDDPIDRKEVAEQNAQDQFSMPALNPEDGSLILLEDGQLEKLLNNCDKKDLMQGRFGNVYATKHTVPGLHVRVAIKEIICGNEDKFELQSTANEMIASRIFHFATVPLNAYIDKQLEDGRRAFYFISPLFENGNLLDCIASDAKCQDPKLNKTKRKMVLYQVASAIDYLHTKVSNIRGTVLHADLSSNNVVLDKCWNARLIDFGLACELNEKQTAKTRTREFGKVGYHYTRSIDSKSRVCDDYHHFGVVILEMLTGKPPKYGNKELRKLHPTDITHSLQKNIWTPGDDDVNGLLALSQECINSVQGNTDTFNSSYIVKKMDNLLEKRQLRYADSNEEQFQTRKCALCLVNNAETGLNRIIPKCNKEINVCVSCMRNSHLSPIRCPYCSEGNVYPKIGYTFAALLIAGNDTEEKALAKSFKNEIVAIRDVLISKWPCAVGIGEDNVKVVVPSTPGDEDELLPQFDNAIKDLVLKEGLETLIVYFTGHHDQKEGFRLGKGSEYITFKYFQQALKKIGIGWNNIRTRVIAFLDCCKPPPIKELLTDEDTKLIQINVCSQLEKSSQPESGSLFKTYFIQALTRKCFNKKCQTQNMPIGNDNCDICPIKGNFVSVHSLHTYIAEHMNRYSRKNQQPHLYVNGIKADDAIIAYNVDFAIDPIILFEHENEEAKKVDVSSNIYHNIETLKERIFENIIEQANGLQKESFKFIFEKLHGVMCIRVYNGIPDRKELKTMLDLSSVMIGKREIVASYRKVEQIRNGKAVIFQSSDSLLKHIDESNIVIPEVKDDIMITREFQCIDDLDDFITYLNSLPVDKNDTEDKDEKSLEPLLTCLKELTSIWRDENGKSETSKILKVGLPCKLDLIVFELVDKKMD